MMAGTRTTFRFEAGVQRTSEARPDDRANVDAVSIKGVRSFGSGIARHKRRLLQ